MLHKIYLQTHKLYLTFDKITFINLSIIPYLELFMKKSISQILAIIFTTALWGCGESIDPEATLEDQRAEIIELLGTTPWGVTNIDRENLDASYEYENFNVTFGEGTYTSVEGRHIWAESGTWEFAEGKSDQIIRDDNTLIDLEIDGDKLTLSFEIEELVYPSGGRTQTLFIKYLFSLFRFR